MEWFRDPWRLSPAMLKEKLGSHSKINIALFEELLVGYDPVEAAYVLPGLKGGFSMGLQGGGPRPPERSWAPSFLSNEERAIINSYLENEVALGRIFGPFDAHHEGHFGLAMWSTRCQWLRRKTVVIVSLATLALVGKC